MGLGCTDAYKLHRLVVPDSGIKMLTWNAMIVAVSWINTQDRHWKGWA
jgi:hypothetical protein